MRTMIESFTAYLRRVLTSYWNVADPKNRLEAEPHLFLFSEELSPFLPHETTFGEQVVFLLALMPHIAPEVLDPFLVQDPDLKRPYTRFGGWRGDSHTGFLPTGETAVFLLSAGGEDKRQEVCRLLGTEHWFHTDHILRCEGQGRGEPFLSGRLMLSEEVLSRVLYNKEYEPGFSTEFPARRITTSLDWNDLILPYYLREDLEEICHWLAHQQEIREQWELGRWLRPGYRCLFYGPPGTGKTLTATLLGKRTQRPVYRVDLSAVVSKYIGETEKNLARLFDRAGRHNWILFFDEADALFGTRTEARSSNDRHSNQETAYLLQRIEAFPGTVLLATNLKDNLDEAFFRRFQSALYFPMPDEEARYRLWQGMLPGCWLGGEAETLLRELSRHPLSGGSMVNVLRSCAVRLHAAGQQEATAGLLRNIIEKELEKEGKIVAARW